MSRAASNIVVLALAKEYIAAEHTVNKVIAGFTVDFVGSTDIVLRRRIPIQPASCVVQQLDRPRDDPQYATINVIVERKEAIEGSDAGLPDTNLTVNAYKTEDVGIVAGDHVRITGMSIGGFIPRVIAGCHVTIAAKNCVGAVGPQIRRPQTQETGTSADNVVLAQTAEDGVFAAVALDIIVATDVASRDRIGQ